MNMCIYHHNCAANGCVDRNVMLRDEALEVLSDKVRKGEPIGFLDAIAAINYQDRLKAELEARLRKTFLGRLRIWFRGAQRLNDLLGVMPGKEDDVDKGHLANAATLGSRAVQQSTKGAKGVLEDRIARLRQEADQLEALKNALPDLEGQAAEALWSLLWK